MDNKLDELETAGAEAEEADELTEPTEPAAPPPAPAFTQKKRIFKISGDTIVEDASMRGLTLDEIKRRLAQAGYAEAANATTTASANADGDEVISFLPAPGRKG